VCPPVPQLHFYVPEEVADAVRRRAQARNLPVSRYLAELVRREVAGWPEEFAGILGGWQEEETTAERSRDPGADNSTRASKRKR
jgi:hypothetical protein